MKNTFGNSISVTLFGESHGAQMGAVIDGLAPGLLIDSDYIEHYMELRRPQGEISTMRREKDNVRFVSGVYNGYTTGAPLCVMIENGDTDSSKYDQIKFTPRPGHADYTAECKYHGFQDHRGGGHFSARITAPLVAAASVLRYALERKGILIGTHIKEIDGISDLSFGLNSVKDDIVKLNDRYFAVIDGDKGEMMRAHISSVSGEGDSVGGILETAVIGVPAGVGEPWFDSMESVISHGIFSVPGVKGIEFGAGFEFARMRGSNANDSFCYENGSVITTTNNNGGINGGITNGMPVIFRTAVKPTPSIFVEQNTVDLKNGENTVMCLKGRHDPCIVHRARVVVDSITAIAVADLLCGRYGTDWLGEA